MLNMFEIFNKLIIDRYFIIHIPVNTSWVEREMKEDKEREMEYNIIYAIHAKSVFCD